MPSPLKRLAAGAIRGVVGQRTRASRERIAVTGFFLGSESPWDRALSRTYFGLSNWVWADFEGADSHHLAFRKGLAQIGPSPKCAVDLGTGAGGTAAIVAATWPDATVTGIDSSRNMIRQARKQHGGLPNLTFAVGDGLRLDLADGAVDLVTSLNYMPFPGEVRRILRPGGRVLVASTFQAVGSQAVAAQWGQHQFALEAQDDADVGSFEIYRRED